MQPYVGEIRPFAGSFAPVGWMTCNGQVLSISQYEVLFTLLGTTYGGDGVQTFALPNLAGRAVLGQGTGSSGTSYQMGQQGGAETITVVATQLPAHNHTFIVSAEAGTSNNPSNNYLAESMDTASPARTILSYMPDTENEVIQPFMPDALTNTGGSQPHENMQPYLAVSYIIAMEGIYPSQY